MAIHSARLVAVIAVVACGVCGVQADDADDLYKSVYEPKVKQALATPDRKDDAALAVELLAAARQQADLPKLAILLANKAHEMTARDPATIAVAADSLTLLVEFDKEHKAELLDKLVEVRQRQLTAARADARPAVADALVDALLQVAQPKVDAKDYAAAIPLYRRALTAATQGKSPRQAEIKAALDDLQRRQKAMEQVNRLRERLLADANDFAAIDELVRMYIIDFDEADEAQKYANRGKDPALKEITALAGKSTTELTPDEGLKLADWYRTLAAAVTDDRKTTPLLRAKECYRATIESSVATDLHRRKADLLAKDVDAALKKIGVGDEVKPRESKAAESQWTDMIALLDLQKDARAGQWTLKNRVLSLQEPSPGVENSHFLFPVNVKGPYEWAMKIEGPLDGGHRFIFPVGDRAAMIVIESRAWFELPGVDKKAPGITSDFRFQKGKTHVLLFTIKPDATTAFIQLKADGKPILTFKGDTSGFEPSTQFQLIPWTAKIIFHEMRVRPLSGGEIKLLREKKP